MSLRKTLLFAAVAAALSTGPALAQDNDLSVSFNVGAATDYVFRGVSNTDENPQVFGGVDVTSGLFYGGVWVSNVDFNDSTDAEFDIYAGVAPTLGAVSLDLGVLYYGYVDAPSGADLDYVELQAKASIPLGPATLGTGLYYVPDSYGHIDTSMYYEVNGEFSATDKLSFSAALGRQTFDGAGDYTTWNVGMGYALTDNLGLDLRYHDTDKHSLGKTYDSRVVLSAKVTF
ncbi:TorF family putative porin [Phenylobacterium sp.]|uniref:TorF family putative porin n=1 Tax=Phenylobacterium sp. TaxID=1871053 RepID=UPI003D2DD17D